MALAHDDRRGAADDRGLELRGRCDSGAALAALVERVEFDPASGAGRVLYRIGVNGAKFDLNAAAREIGTGALWRPHGESQALYTSCADPFRE